MMTDIITLISQQRSVDDFGDAVISETTRTVYAEPASVGFKEFYQAAAVGLQPELKFTIQDYLDYNGEQLLEHEGIRYRIIRTFRKGQRLELVCTREVNTHGHPEVSR